MLLIIVNPIQTNVFFKHELQQKCGATSELAVGISSIVNLNATL